MLPQPRLIVVGGALAILQDDLLGAGCLPVERALSPTGLAAWP
ncbi:hypothetical protein [Streptomyces sp. NPDC019937]